MPYRSILVPARGTEDETIALNAAADLAAEQGGRVTVLFAQPPAAVQLSYVSPPGFYIDAGLVSEVQAGIETTRAKVRQHAREAAERAQLAYGSDMVVVEEERALLDAILPRLPVTDLMLAAPSCAMSEFTAQALLQARTPVLIAREGLTLKPATIAIGWDGGLNAGRAVRAAMPLLGQAERVVVLQQADCLPGHRRDAADPARLGDYLALHGVEVEFESIAGDGDTGDAILQAARCCEADILVCGAWGHSRVAEFVFGGVTRKVIGAAWPSVLLAH